MTLTLGRKKRREGLNVCMNDEFNLLHHVGVVVKKVRAAAAAAETAAETAAAHNGPRGKKRIPLGGHHSIFGGGGVVGVFLSDKLFISTWLGGALNFLNFTTAYVKQFLK